MLVEGLNGPLQRGAAQQVKILSAGIVVHLLGIAAQGVPAVGVQVAESVAQRQPDVPFIGLQLVGALVVNAERTLHLAVAEQFAIGAGQLDGAEGGEFFPRQGGMAADGVAPGQVKGVGGHLKLAVAHIHHHKGFVQHGAVVLVYTEGEGGITAQVKGQLLDGGKKHLQFGTFQHAVAAVGVAFHGQGQVERPAGYHRFLYVFHQADGFGTAALRGHVDVVGALHTARCHALDARHLAKKRTQAVVDLVHVVAAHFIAGAEGVVAAQCHIHHMRALHMHEEVFVHIGVVQPGYTGVAGRQHRGIVQKQAAHIVGVTAVAGRVEQGGVADVVGPGT